MAGLEMGIGLKLMGMGRNGKTESHSRTPLAGRLAMCRCLTMRSSCGDKTEHAWCDFRVTTHHHHQGIYNAPMYKTNGAYYSSIQLVKRQRKQMCFQLFAELCDDVTES